MDKKSPEETAEAITEWGKKMTWGVTLPIFLFVLGIFTMPVGLLFWILGLIMFLTTFSKSIENYASTQKERD
jgi:cytochrome c biogenesis protein CcdA